MKHNKILSVTDDDGRTFSVGQDTRDGYISEFIHGSDGHIYAWLSSVVLVPIDDLAEVDTGLETDDGYKVSGQEPVYMVRYGHGIIDSIEKKVEILIERVPASMAKKYSDDCEAIAVVKDKNNLYITGRELLK